MSASLHALGRRRVARRAFIVLAMLALALKAVIPVGYMFAAIDGHATLVMCPAGIHQPVATDMPSAMASMPGMDMSAAAPHIHGVDTGAGAAHAAHAAHGASHAATDCPFALATGAALVAAIDAPGARHFEWIPDRRPAVPAVVPRTPPLRHEAPRGPPSLA